MVSDRTKTIEGRFLAGALFLFAILAFFVLEQFLQYVIGGALLVFAFFPIHRRLRRIFKRRAVAAFLSFLLVILVVIGPIVLVGFMVFKDAVNFARGYDPDRLNETVQNFLIQYGIEEPEYDNNTTTPRTSDTANWLGNTIKSLAERIGTELLGVVPGLFIGLVITGFVIYYGFAEGESFYTKFRHALPLPDDIEESLFRDIKKVTQVVFVGNILVSVLGGVVGAISFIVFGVPNAIFWGFIMIILGVLPVVGAPFVWVPAAGWLFLQGHIFGALGILIVNGAIVIGYIDNILRPKLIGKVANIHPVLVLIGVLGGVEAFGPLGFVTGPLVLAVLIAIVRSYTEWHPRWRERRREGIETYSPGAEIEVVPAEGSRRGGDPEPPTDQPGDETPGRVAP